VSDEDEIEIRTLSRRRSRARKTYHCYCCAREISQGTKYERLVCIGEDGFEMWRSHFYCRED